ncbi:hypothetical protein KOR34_26130 [Posidoniimonas corsicana]|uniref:Uncharacterized protein n=1 Tax=Posidoniimonas corsicana TaxID=1938618 RepID=A0A5C5VIQ4_9BACT|nr:BBP7 family outer membrane beta-barrel protein [Posidoniimonas corsicana]TWT37655.1 hypothetical protein KOR34_26130 [Posidoniimonas corsicana]
MSRSAVTIVALLAFCAAGPSSSHAQQRGVVAGSSGVWINGQYFGHNPGGGRFGESEESHEPTSGDSGCRNDLAESETELVSYNEHLVAGCCDDPACGCELDLGCGDTIGCGDCVRPRKWPRVYGAVEYVYGWAKGSDSPALVTTSDNGTAQDDAGVLGLASTTTLLGGDSLNNGGQSGGRLTLGTAAGSYRNRRVEFIYSFLEDADEAFATSSDEFPILARPFFNSQSGQQDALLIGFGGLVSGGLSVDASSEFRSYELQMRQDACCYRGANMELTVGYRAAELDDGIAIRQTSLALSGPTAGATTNLEDLFSTSNTFHGGQVGFTCQLVQGRRWSYDCTVKTALGATRQKARIAGSTTVTTGGGSSTSDAGLLVQGSNAGEYSRSEFSAVSEVGLTLRYRLKKSTSLSVGYNIVFWSDVLRAAEQIDAAVNPTQIPPGTLTGDPRPAFGFASTSYWAQGFRAGLESRF